jgi:hypothetical protein
VTDYAFESLMRGLGACNVCAPVPQPRPGFAVAPSAEDGEPILTVSGPSPEAFPPASNVPLAARGLGACCTSCEHGGTCECALPAVSQPKAPISVPGSTSFPVGFGQPANAPITTTSVPVAMASSWTVPLAIALACGAAGFGLAYLISKRTA